MPDLFIYQPAFYMAALAAVLITGISKSGLGGGMGQLSVPIMAMFISPVTAAAIMLPILCLIDIINLWGYRKDWHRTNVAIMVPGAVIGIGIGALTYKYVDENAVRIILGVIVLIFAFSYFTQDTPMSTASKRRKLLGGFCGMLSGFTSFVAHAGSGPMKFYLLPQRLDKRVFVGTHVMFFFLVNQIKIWPYFWLGQFTTENLATSLVLVPAVPIGVFIGWRLIRVIPEELFYKICYVLLFIAGGKLVWDGLSRGGII